MHRPKAPISALCAAGKVNLVFTEKKERKIAEMSAAGQLRSQYLCINSLPFAPWMYHPTLGYSDCVFESTGETDITQAIITVPGETLTTWCGNKIKGSPDLFDGTAKKQVHCNVKADGSVTLLSDLDFQVRCCQGQCDPRGFSSKTYHSTKTEICIARKLTETSQVKVKKQEEGSFLAPPGVALDTNWYPGDFANVKLGGKLDCGDAGVAPARVAVSLFALLNGVAIAAKTYGVPTVRAAAAPEPAQARGHR